MADAYGRLTGKPGVCLVTAGPGGLNSMAGVAQAYGAASPMVHIGGAVPLKADLEAFHGVDDPAFVHEMFKHITKWSARVERIEDIPEVMAKAFHIARSGRPGPVHVELPRADRLQRIHPPGGARGRCRRTSAAPTVVRAARPAGRRALREAADGSALAGHRRGQGHHAQGRDAGARGARATKLQAPVVFAQDAIGVIPEDASVLRRATSRATAAIRCAPRRLKRADLVLGVGLRAGTAEMTELRARAPEEPDPDRLRRRRGSALSRRGRARRRSRSSSSRRCSSASATTSARATTRSSRRWPKARPRSARRLADQNEPHRNDKPIHPGVLMDAMNAVLDDDAVVASDVGNCQHVGAHLPPHRDARVVHAVGRVERDELRAADRDRREDGVPAARRRGARRRRRVPHDDRRPADGGRVRREHPDGRAERRRVRPDASCSRPTSTATPTARRSRARTSRRSRRRAAPKASA